MPCNYYTRGKEQFKEIVKAQNIKYVNFWPQLCILQLDSFALSAYLSGILCPLCH